jgi:phage/plasmid-associated DNA primase
MDRDKPAYIPDAKCKRFGIMVSRLFRLSSNPRQMQRHFYEVLGYLMCPSDVLQIQFVLFGESSSGKHELNHVIRAVIGDKNMDNLVHTENQRPDIIHTDEQINYTMVIPFYGNFNMPEAFPIYKFDEMLNLEIPGIVQKALTGLRRLIRRGKFKEPDDCKDAHRQYFRTIDHVGNFLKERCVLVDDNSVKVSRREMFWEYLKWADESKMRLNTTAFTEELRARGIAYHRSASNERFYLGIALVNLQ